MTHKDFNLTSTVKSLGKKTSHNLLQTVTTSGPRGNTMRLEGNAQRIKLRTLLNDFMNWLPTCFKNFSSFTLTLTRLSSYAACKYTIVYIDDFSYRCG